jgi:lipoprotein-anchoring transpeptidase ErfK/SrfK
MMIIRVSTVFAVFAAAGLAGTPAALAQSYPPPPGYSQPVQPAPYGAPGGYVDDRGTPDFDRLDEDDRGVALSPPGYQQAPIYTERAPVAPGTSDGGAPRPPGAIDGGPTGAVQSQTPGAVAGDGRPLVLSALPPEDQPETGPRKELPAHLRRQEVSFPTKEPAGTIVVDTANTQLYYILGNGRAIRYGIRVGREGFTWSGVQKVTRKAEWPDWHPPAEMIERQPYLPRFMAGGDGNPLGARAMYLGNTVYRIHGTNQPSTIGQFVSSGCFGMLNEDVTDLFDRVKVGTRVVVLPGGKPPAPPVTASAQPAGVAAAPMASVGAAPRPASAGVPNQGPTVVPPLPAPVTIR